MLTKLKKELADLTLRYRLYRYDFFDGTSRKGVIPRYLLGEWKKDWISAYEESIERYVQVAHAITFGAGRMALYAILEALDIGPGDEVMLPAYTCVVVPNAVLYRGATPVYVDIRESDFNIDVGKIENAITARTRAIVAQHTFGQPCDIEEILRIARRHGFRVIEDCAHSFGASFKGRKLGTLGDLAFVSTDHTKVLSTGVGGFVICASQPLAERIREIQWRAASLPWHCVGRIILQYGILALLNRPRLYWAARIAIGILRRVRVFFFFSDELKLSRPAMYPVKLSNFQAFVGWHELKELERNIKHRREIARRYAEVLGGDRSGMGDGAYLRYSVLVDSPEKWERAVGKYFTVGRWFSSVAQGRDNDWEAIGYRPGSCPVAEGVATHIINFPTHFRIDERAIRRFRDIVVRWGLAATVAPRNEKVAR